MGAPLAYFLTWTCYGQRLHGDPRGSVDDRHNRRGTPMLPPDGHREEIQRLRMKGPAVELSPPMRAVAEGAVESLAADRQWLLIARNIRSTHAYVVVNCRGRTSPERAMADFKGRITRELRRSGLAASDARLWTEHGSTRWINHEAGLYGAILYVNEWQAGPNRKVLEEHKRSTALRIRELREWLASQGLPADGRGVVIGESEDERRARVAGETALPPANEAGAG